MILRAARRRSPYDQKASAAPDGSSGASYGPGMMDGMNDPVPLRIGDLERSEALARLRENHAAGRLTDDELREREQAASAARTQLDLDPLFVDLPPAGPLAYEPYPFQVGPSVADSYPHQALVAPDDPDPVPATRRPADRVARRRTSDLRRYAVVAVAVAVIAAFTVVTLTTGSAYFFPWWFVFFLPAVTRSLRGGRDDDDDDDEEEDRRRKRRRRKDRD